MSAATSRGRPAAPIDVDEVLALIVARTAAVLAVSSRDVLPSSRFADDLHADSLDLVEVVESVERELHDRGVDASLPQAELLAVRTVRDAAERIARRCRAGEGEG